MATPKAYLNLTFRTECQPTRIHWEERTQSPIPEVRRHALSKIHEIGLFKGLGIGIVLTIGVFWYLTEGFKSYGEGHNEALREVSRLAEDHALLTEYLRNHGH